MQSPQFVYLNFIFPEDLGRVASEVSKYSSRNKNYFEHEPYRVISKNGKIHWVSDYTVILRNDAGEITHYIGYLVDISKLKKAEEALRANEERLELVLKGAELGLWDWRIPTGEVVFNERWANMLGYALDEIEPNAGSWEKLMHPDDIEPVTAALTAHLEGRIPVYQTEHRLLAKSGEWKWILDTGKVFEWDEQGKPVRMLGIHQDITGRKQAENELRESEENLFITFNSIGDGVIATDEKGMVTRMNPVAEKLCGWPIADARGKPLTEVFKIINAQTREFFKNPVDIVMEKGFTVGLANHTILVSKNGNEYHIADSAAPIKDKEAKIVGVILVFTDVSKEYNTQKILVENEKRYRELSTLLRLLSDNMPDMLWAKNMNKEYIFVNKTICTGLLNAEDTEEPIGKTDMFFAMRERDSHPDNPEWHTFGEICGDSDADTLEAMKPMQFDEFGNVKGKFLFLDVHKAPLYDNTGQLIGVVGSARDVTAAKETENQLRKLSWAVEQSPASVVITDLKGTIEYVNPKFTEVTGYTSEEAIGQNSRILKSGEHPSEFYAELWKTISAGKEWNGELHNKKKNGELYWESVLISPIKNEKGELLYFLGVKEDITEWKQAKEELIKSKEKAEENEKRLDAFINSIPDIVCYKDGKGKWLLANDADLDLFCLKGVDYFGKTDFELSEYTNEIYKNAFIACMATDEIAWHKKTISRGIEIIPTVNSGDKVFEIFKIPTFTPNGERRGLAVIGRDITKLHETQEHLIKAKEKAEESDRLKSAFLANMSHEIRTPMNGILGFAELLKEPHLTDEQQQAYIKIIRKSSARMLNIINDIVDISKIEAGLIKLDIKESNVNEQIEYIFTFFKPEAEGKGIELSFKNSLPAEEATIKTDREKLYSILTNLLKNAIKYTEKGSIVFGYEKKGEYPEFYVKDTGIGIPQDRQQAIFERFIQADIEDKMARQGSGLGLSISKAYVNMLGGKIWLESEVGKGSAFYFTLPYNTEREENKIIDNDVLAHEEEHKVENLKILIAEDDETSGMFITIAVEMLGKEIIQVKTGVEAVETCRNNPDIDLVLMDIQLPGLNGYEATKQIRQFNKDVVIIAQTAFGLMGDRVKAIEAGCNDYISKPINKNVLLSLIQKCFREKEKKTDK